MTVRVAVRALGLGAILVAADAAHACRCAPRPLADYFAAADVVVVGRALETWIDPDDAGRRRVRFEIAAKPFKGDPGTVDGFATPVESAACGYAVELGREYVVFAGRRPENRLAWFDTCGGTRSVDRDAAEGARAFVDVPADDVLPRLSALREQAGSDPRASATAVLPLPGDPQAMPVGLLELPGLLPAPATPPVPARTVTVFAQPRDDAPVLVTVREPAQLATREHAYEAPGALVREVRPGWFRLRLADGRDAWLRAADAGAYHPLAELLIGRLSYLGPHWDGWVWPSAGAGYPQRAGRRVAHHEQPVRVLAAESIGDTLWLQVEILEADPCTGGEVRVAHAGWVPAYTPGGEPTAWFHSRGC
jgi:hypothetical protein